MTGIIQLWKPPRWDHSIGEMRRVARRRAAAIRGYVDHVMSNGVAWRSSHMPYDKPEHELAREL